MIAVILPLLISGIGVAQVLSNPKEVTLRWLRLGGIIALSLAGVTVAIQYWPDRQFDRGELMTTLAAIPFVIQLLAVQKAWRLVQRIASAVGIISMAWIAVHAMPENFHQPIKLMEQWAFALSSGAVLGGFLMAMLLGHAYLTAGNEMTQKPFARLVVALAALLFVRLVVVCVWGVWPIWHQGLFPWLPIWDKVMIFARVLAGLIMPSIFTYMVYDCVKRRANQSATGILYVIGMLIMLGEGIAMALARSIGHVF